MSWAWWVFGLLLLGQLGYLVSAITGLVSMAMRDEGAAPSTEQGDPARGHPGRDRGGRQQV
jgi:hypothetical protein